MRKITFAAAAAAAAFATPAMAQDADTGGFHASAIIGYDDFNVDDGVDEDNDGDILYGANIGYDIPLGGAFVGIEGEISESEIGYTTTDFLVAGDELNSGVGMDLYVGARAGVAVAPGTRVYVKGGYTMTELETNYDNGTGTNIGVEEDIDGFRVGGGVEFEISNAIMLRAEYRYSDYGEFEYNGVGTGADLTRSQVVAGLGVKF